MRFVPAGEHKLHVKSAAGTTLERVVVNAIAELMFSRFGSHPQVVEYGRLDMAWMKRYALPNLNCMVGGGEVDPLFLEYWKEQGRRFLVEIYAKPYLSPGDWTGQTATITGIGSLPPKSSRNRSQGGHSKKTWVIA